jgi:hypothetical protein
VEATETERTDLVGDGFDSEALWTKNEVALFLKMSPDRVYALPIPKIRLSPRRLRWRPEAVKAYAKAREEAA